MKSSMTPAVRRALAREKEGRKEVTASGKCPGGERCPYPDILCTECKLEIGDS